MSIGLRPRGAMGGCWRGIGERELEGTTMNVKLGMGMVMRAWEVLCNPSRSKAT